MAETEFTVDNIRELLDRVEQLSPEEETQGSRVSYRTVEEETVDDTFEGEEPISPDEDVDDEWVEEAREIADSGLDEEIDAPTGEFNPAPSVPVAAVDCGFVRLGETENGVIIALRATLVVDEDGEQRVRLFRTGPVYLHYGYKLPILHQLGKQLGKEDLFVEVDTSDPDNHEPTSVKSGVADSANQYSDRFRNWFERLVQKIATQSITDGIVLLDGALTLRTRDTPQSFLRELADAAEESGNALVAISKQSNLQVEGKSVRFWLDDMPNQSCYRLLSRLMDEERSDRVLGNTYAVRFSPVGTTFRMDVKALPGQMDREAIDTLYNSVLMRGGYPDILVRAHAHSYFTSPHVTYLQAQASAKYSLEPKPEADLAGIFGPFGGRFK